MARVALDPPRTLSYRIAEWFVRQKYGEVLESIPGEDTEPTRGGMLPVPDNPRITFVMPNSRRFSLPGVEVRPYNWFVQKVPAKGGTDLERNAQALISIPESTVWWMLLCPVSHYHRRLPDGRRMEMLLEDKNVMTGGTSSTSPVGRCPASDLLP